MIYLSYTIRYLCYLKFLIQNLLSKIYFYISSQYLYLHWTIFCDFGWDQVFFIEDLKWIYVFMKLVFLASKESTFTCFSLHVANYLFIEIVDWQRDWFQDEEIHHWCMKVALLFNYAVLLQLFLIDAWFCELDKFGCTSLDVERYESFFAAYH